MRVKTLLSVLVGLVLIAIGCDKNDNGQDGPNPPDETWPTENLRIVKSGLSFPWEILWGKDDNIWMTERGGRVSAIDPKTGNTIFTYAIPDVVANGEGGLLGMVQHPDFKSNGYLYTVYNYDRNGTYTEKVVRFTYANNTLGSPQVLIDNIPAANIHNGSRLLITQEASPKLFITTGDAANLSLVQNVNSLAGKILRINLDGSIPSDNPIPGNPLWSLGHRNPQGLVLANNLLYITEHGPSTDDEINIIERNRNFGWPNVNGPCNEAGEASFCTQNNVKTPLWTSGTSTVAVCGLDYYNNDRIPAWKNSLLMVTLKDATLYQFKLNSNGQGIESSKQHYRGNWGRLRDICISPAGRVYLCTSNGGGNDVIVEIQQAD
jgi:glucose/arabinose dehydrogenase